MDDSHGNEGTWALRTPVDRHALYGLLECVLDIVVALDGIAGDEQPTSLPHAQLAARHVSVALRKVLLSSGPGSLRRCIGSPSLHPPVRLVPNASPVRFVRRFDESAFTVSFADGESVSLAIPAHDHTTVVYPLCGVQHIAERQFRILSPFDIAASPIKLQRWLNTKVLQVDDVVFSAEDLLRLLANREGAHLDENFPLVSPVPFDVDNTQRFAMASAVTFGGLSYPQLFSLFTGLYVANQVRRILDDLPFPPGHPSIVAMTDAIRRGPATLTSENAAIDNISQPLVVLGKDRTLQGDYSRGIVTTIRVP